MENMIFWSLKPFSQPFPHSEDKRKETREGSWQGLSKVARDLNLHKKSPFRFPSDSLFWAGVGWVGGGYAFLPQYGV